VGGRLIVVAFHSLEDRIVKRFLAERTARNKGVSRYMPGEVDLQPASFIQADHGHVVASDEEIDLNHRSRSAKLRSATRTAAPAFKLQGGNIGLPRIDRKRP
jgi:16S rRNA (cytosine1402-N4)-methyltransferase